MQNVKYAEQVATDNGEGELSGNWEGGPRCHSRTGNSRRSLRKKQRKTKLSWRIVISSTLWFSSKFVCYVWAEYILKDITSEPFILKNITHFMKPLYVKVLVCCVVPLTRIHPQGYDKRIRPSGQNSTGNLPSCFSVKQKGFMLKRWKKSFINKICLELFKCSS